MKHKMPVLTEHQRADLQAYITGSEVFTFTEVRQLEVWRDAIALAAITSEPDVWRRMPDQGFHLPMMLTKEQGPPPVEGEFYPLYTAPLVLVVKLPAPRPDFAKGDKVDIEWRGMCDGFNSCLESVKRLNGISS